MASTISMKNDIVRELGLEKLSPEDQENVLNKISEALLKRVYLETFEKLEENDRGKLLDMIDGNPETGEVEVFFQEKIPNYSEVVAKVVDDFKSEFKESMAFAQSA